MTPAELLAERRVQSLLCSYYVLSKDWDAAADRARKVLEIDQALQLAVTRPPVQDPDILPDG